MSDRKIGFAGLVGLTSSQGGFKNAIKQSVQSQQPPKSTAIPSPSKQEEKTTTPPVQSSAQWYYTENANTEVKGPVTETSLRSLISSKKVVRGNLVWCSYLHDWTPIENTAFSEKHANKCAARYTYSDSKNIWLLLSEKLLKGTMCNLLAEFIFDIFHFKK